MIIEIAAFIATESGFVYGDTIQVAHRTPASPVRCSVVIESPGGTLDDDLPDRVNKMIQVISRATTYMDARADAWTIFNALRNPLPGSVLPLGVRKITAVAPATQDYEAIIGTLTDPQYIGLDDKRRYEFSTNYLFRIQNA